MVVQKIIPATLLGIVLLSSFTAAEDTIVMIEVQAGDYLREHTPVFLRLPAEVADDRRLVMQRVEDRKRIGIQRIVSDKPMIAWMIEKPLGAGLSRKYKLLTVDRVVDRVPTMVTVKQDDRRLVVNVLGEPVLAYNHAIVESPQGLDPVYRRSGYIHPIYNPRGQSVTGDFPPDHAHQHALFLAWVNTTFGDHAPDFWNQAGKTASIRHSTIIGTPVSGSVFGSFQVRLEHIDITDPESPLPVLLEDWTVRVYRVKEFFLFDLESRQRCAGKVPLTINQHHYGGLALRGSHQWFDEQNAVALKQLTADDPSAEQLAKAPLLRNYLTSEGKTWHDGNQTRARWVDMHGALDGKPSGITVMGHPGNYQAPQKVRLHPTKPYFCFAPMADGEFQIAPGKNYISRYRFFVHNGSASADASERRWNDYAHPPTVLISSIEDK
jgi:hypothetical protein